MHVAQRFEHLLETYRRPDEQRWKGTDSFRRNPLLKAAVQA